MKTKKGYFAKVEDCYGKQIHNLTFIKLSHKDKYGNSCILCKCTCGNMINRPFSAINKISTEKSCGCLNHKIYSDAGKSHRKYKINEDKIIENSETAYISGLLGTDGCITRYTIHLGLQKKDISILEKINSYFEHTGKIYKRENFNTISITNEKLCLFFRERNIIERKSKIYKVPEIYKNNRNYWRGCIDGDGSILVKEGRIILSICGTYDIVSNFKIFCNTIVDTNNVICKRKTSENFYIFSITGEKAFQILNYLYDENDALFITRKMENINSVREKYKHLLNK